MNKLNDPSTGVSLDSFISSLDLSSFSGKKVFIDGGAHHLEGLNYFIDRGVVTNEFEIHSFEANPACQTQQRIKDSQNLDSFKINFHEKAVWTEDSSISFKQENHQISCSGSPSDGKSDVDGWGSSVDLAQMHHGGYETKIVVPSIDFSKFLTQFSSEDLIFCKFDIECSEYPVLRHLINAGEIKRIHTLFVEFHPHFTNGVETHEGSTMALVNQIRDLGVNVFLANIDY